MGKKVTSDFRVRKCAKRKQQPVDRISQLPNEILVYILSFLTHEDAVRTSVLSKRWIGIWIELWMHATELNFESTKMWEEIRKRIKGISNCLRLLLGSKRQQYAKWVNKVLQSHKAIVLDVFRIRFDLDKSSKKDIDKWLPYAFARTVHRLELNLLPYGTVVSCERRFSYDFPHCLLGLSDGISSGAAVFPSDFSCRNGGINNSDAFFGGFKSLRSLKFDNVKVSGSVLQFFLRNCPFLEHLVVGNSPSVTQFEVCGPSLALKHLEINYCPNLVSLRVCDANIVSLQFIHGKNLVLKNVPKLVDVYVGGGTMSNLIGSVISWLSCCLSKLEFLTLNISNAQQQLELDTIVELPQLTRLKQLTFFRYAPNDCSLTAFTSLIRASPNLEKFVLKTDRRCEFGIFRPMTKLAGAIVAFPLRHLKVVEVLGYFGHTSEVELVKYLLDNAVGLERIMIDPRDQPLQGPSFEDKSEEEALFRNLAKEQLPGLVPSHVELVLL